MVGLFTGLISHTGRIRRSGARLAIETALAGELERGDSIAVNGVCLTAVQVDRDRFEADVMEETLDRTSLGELASGQQVNLELPLRVGDRLDGHFVQGHVDATGHVEAIEQRENSRVLRIAAAGETLRYVVEKGSIAIDGVSLTVVDVDAGGFSVSLIPETLERTTLGSVAVGDPVNLEVDMLAKYAVKAQ